MRLRTSICLVIALCVLAAGPATAALAQISDSGQASQVQYPDISTREDPPADDDLPVTGFVAIPLVVTGVVLLLAGGLMHVRTRRE